LFSNKLGQGLSLNVIILAALGVIVLLVLIAILTGQSQKFGKGIESSIQSCSDVGGREIPVTAECEKTETTAFTVQTKPGFQCCVKKSP